MCFPGDSGDSPVTGASIHLEQLSEVVLRDWVMTVHWLFDEQEEVCV